MTNMWLGIDIKQLCDQHLLGIHNEIHKECGAIENHPHGEAILDGHYRLAQVDTTELVSRHEEVVSEMEKRGMNHDSPLEYRDEHGLLVSGFPIEQYNKITLSNRCDECKVTE